MSPQFTDDDIGKTVINARGKEVGIVANVEHGTAHVEPDPGIADTIKAKLGWGGTDEDAYPLQEESVAEVTGDEVRLETDLSGSGGGAGTTGRTSDTTSAGTTDTGRESEMHDDEGMMDDDDDLIGDDDEGMMDDDDDLIGDDDEGMMDDDDDDDLIGDDDDDDLVGDDTR
ncbi:hypothetical protein [Natrialba swarupiae]|uniref:PRC-barrel domain containing protein n=1 Tax=Natrialba swarupiae TaxID=2448032 RepID=A0A5D5AFM6_9EURY|nr:hypothetical protein [Natrialba swarupiae]TYT60618.1 hypothetical protein FYC77_17935 [Natrialba swarupiae]